MNILLINQPLNNRGDESAHKALVRRILESRPNVMITCIWVAVENIINNDNIESFKVKNPRIKYQIIQPYGFWKASSIYIRLLHYYMKTRSKWICKIYPTFHKLLSYYKSADLVFCAPGGICMGGFQDWRHLFMLSLAKDLNKPLIYYGRSFGPFPEVTSSNREFKKISLEMLNYFSFLSIRDNKTEELAKTLKLKKYYVTVDSAFLSSVRVQIPNELRSKIDTDDYIVFVPNSLIWHFAYKDKVSYSSVLKFYCTLLDIMFKYYQNSRIIMLPQTFGRKDRLGNDVNLFRDIAKKYNDNRLVVIEDKYDSDVQQSIISKAKFVCGARYHSIVFAINQSRPFIALSYEHKIAGLLKTLGCSDKMIDITDSFNSEVNMQKTVMLFETQLQNLSFNFAITDKAKEISSSCFDNLLSYFDSFTDAR